MRSAGEVLAFLVVVILVAVFLPRWEGPNRRQHLNEAVTVGNLRTINTLQNDYAFAHPGQGFSCELSRLKGAETANNQGYDRQGFLVSGAQSGYSFAVIRCVADSRGATARYVVTAVPLEPNKSGFRAFCTDESGAIWFDSAGSAENCVANRRPLD